MNNYYEDIKENVFVPLDCVEKFKGLYEINKLGHIKTKSSGKIRTSFGKDRSGYPTVGLTNFKTGVRRSYGLHVLLAKTFIPNPDNKPIVDHIIPGKENRGNYELSNLRWATYSENNKNKIVTGRQNILYAKLDSSGNEIERFKISDFSRKEQKAISASIRRKGTYRSFYWKRIDLSVESYINKFGKPHEHNWRVCLRDPYFECNKNGLIRIKKDESINYRD